MPFLASSIVFSNLRANERSAWFWHTANSPKYLNSTSIDWRPNKTYFRRYCIVDKFARKYAYAPYPLFSWLKIKTIDVDLRAFSNDTGKQSTFKNENEAKKTAKNKKSTYSVCNQCEYKVIISCEHWILMPMAKPAFTHFVVNFQQANRLSMNKLQF